MTVTQDRTRLEIDVYSDPICPWCFIGKRRLEEGLAQRPDIEAQIFWRTFQLNPHMPPQGMDRKTYLETKFGGPENAQRVYGNIAEAGLTAGIEFRFDLIVTTPNTQLAHRLIRYCQGQDPAGTEKLVTTLFESYFLQGLNIGEIDVLVDLARKAGFDGEAAGSFLDGNELHRDVLEEDSAARRLGINGVPCFIIEKQFALSGAQEPKAFFPLFDLIAEKKRSGEMSS